MPTYQLDKDELLIRCACGSLDHRVVLIYDGHTSRENNLKYEGDDFYLTIDLEHSKHGIRRFWAGLKYIMGGDAGYCDIVLRKKDFEEIERFVASCCSTSSLPSSQ